MYRWMDLRIAFLFRCTSILTPRAPATRLSLSLFIYMYTYLCT